MKYLWVVSLLAAISAAEDSSTTEAPSHSVKPQDVEFLTKLVSDVSHHIDDYFFFLRTADIKIPKEFGSMADRLRSYTDDSYTTLLEASDFDVTLLESFATHLDWYETRLEVSGINTATSTSKDLGSALYAPIGLAFAASLVGLL